MRWLLATIVSLAALTVAALTWLLYSEQAVRWALDQLDRLESVHVDEVTGSLAHGLAIGSLTVTTATTTTTLKSVRIDIDVWRSLVYTKAIAETIDVDRVQMTRFATGGAEPLRLALPLLPVPIEVRRLIIERFVLDGLADSLTPGIYGRLNWDSNALSVEDAIVATDTYRVSLAARMGTRAPHAVRGTVDWQYGDASGQARLAGNLRRLELEHRLDRPFQATTQGVVKLLERTRPEVELETSIAAVELDRLAARDAVLRIEGTIDDYRGEVVANVAWRDVLDGTLSATFAGARAQLRHTRARLETAAGALAVEGRVALSAPYPAQLDVAASGVDPLLLERWLPGVSDTLAGTIDGTASVDGTLDRFEVAGFKLTGSVDGAALRASGEASRDGATWQARAWDLSWGDNTARFDGTLTDDVLDGDLTIDLRDPARLDDRLAGSLRANVRLSERLSAPRIDAAFETSRLTVASVLLEDVDGSLVWDDGVISRAAIDRGNITVGALAVTAVRGTFERRDDRARGALSWSVTDQEGSLTATAVHDEQGWRVAIPQTARLALPRDTLLLDRDVTVRWSPRVAGGEPAVHVAAHCWHRGEAARLCISDATYDGGRLRAAGELSDLAVASIPLPVTADMTGALHAAWSIAYDDAALTGFAEFHTDGLGIATDVADAVAFPDLHGRADLLGERIEATLTSRSDTADLTGTLTVRELFAEPTLEAQITGSISDLAFTSHLSRRLGTVAGSLTAALTAVGPLAAPTITGRAELLASELQWLDPHLDLRDVRVTAQLRPDGNLDIDGAGTSGDGQLMLDAKFDAPFSATRALAGTFRATNVPVQAPDIELLVSADLAMHLSSEGIAFDGRVELPRGRITVDTLPATVGRRSDDVVVVNRPADDDRPTRLSADINVAFGDDVRFTGYGLDTGLTGAVRLQQSHRGDVSLSGQVGLSDGVFEAFGQTLSIRAGSLTFTGPPTRPYVDAQAVRTVDVPSGEVLVGIHIRGPADAITSELFSRPSMSDAERLSYLVTGRPLDSTTAAEGEELSNAAIGLGMVGAAPVINEIRQRVGLEELGAQGSGEDLTLIAGKRLSDKVFVRYTYRAFARLSAFIVSYELTRRLSLEANASEAPGTDLVYRVGDR